MLNRKRYYFLVALMLSASIVSYNVNAQETTLTESTSQAIEKPQYESVKSLIETLQAKPKRVSVMLNSLSSTDNKIYTGIGIGYLRDGDYYYIATTQTGEADSSVNIQTQDGAYRRAYISAMDLAKNAATSLNNAPDKFKDTAIEQFYTYAQENADKLEDVYVEVPADELFYDEMLQQIQAEEQFILELLKQFVEQTKVEPTVQELDEVGEVTNYFIDASAAKELATIAEPLVKDHASLNNWLTAFKEGYTGSIGFSLHKGYIALSMMSPNSSVVLNYSITMDNAVVKVPQDDKIMTADAFTQMVGVDIFKAFNTQQ